MDSGREKKRILLIFILTCVFSSIAHGRGLIQTDVYKGDATKGEILLVATNVRSSVSQKDSSTNPAERKANAACPDVCLTKGCTKAAAKVIGKMNLTADPCEDFFDFSCGSFIHNTVIPDEKTSISSFSVVGDSLKEKLRALIEVESKASDSNTTKMVKDLYSSCMNTSQVNRLGLEPLREVLRKMGGWPVIEGKKWKENTFDWTQANYINRKMGYSVDYYFDFSVSTDVKNSTKRIIWVDQLSLGLSREYLMKGIDDSDVQAYLTYSIDAATLLGASEATAKAEMTEALLFQIQLANISLPREQRRNTTKLYNLYTLANLTKIVPEIPWVQYINTILPPKVEVNESEVIGVSDINYFTKFVKIMRTTPKRVQANYLRWRVVAASISYLTEDIRGIQLKYSQALTGLKTRAPRWKECLGIVSGRLSYAVSNLYIENHFDDGAKAQAEELVRYVREEFRRVLTATTWMDAVTKQSAYQKADVMKQHIAYPPELKNLTIIYEHYKEMKVDRGPLLDNMLRLGEYGTSYAFGKLREKIDKSDWKRRGAVAVVNAYFSSTENSITFPAGIWQGDFFEPDRPGYMNFGGIGHVIGHEITHGFDDQGKQFDSEGNLFNWWHPATDKEFLKKSQCIINQYGNFTAPENGLKLNGVNTQGENIADNGGVKQAYRAYLQWVADNGQEKRLPGLQEYTTNQAFWISAAQIWCSKYRSQSLKIRILTGVHSPGRFRVLGPLSNSEEFANDWNCPVGSKMNPVKKCVVWH